MAYVQRKLYDLAHDVQVLDHLCCRPIAVRLVHTHKCKDEPSSTHGVVADDADIDLDEQSRQLAEDLKTEGNGHYKRGSFDEAIR